MQRLFETIGTNQPGRGAAGQPGGWLPEIPVILTPMFGGFTDRLKPLLLSAVLFGALGGMASYGYFFWKNREMCPCAAAGLEGGEGIAVAEPYSQDRIVGRAVTFGLVFAGVGVLIGLAALGPRIRWKDESDD